MDQLIVSYMIHHGYSGSAAALKKNSVYLTEPDSVEHDLLGNHDDGFQQRLAVKNAVVHGDIDQAIELLSIYFPSMFKTTKTSNNNNDHAILFQLKCQKFVEMIRAYDTHVGRQGGSNVDTFTDSRSNSSNNQGHQPHNDDISSSSKDTHSSTEQIPSEMIQTDLNSKDDDDNDDDDNDVPMQTIMAYGKDLKDEFDLDSSPIIMDKLKQVFSLLAYPNPSSSPMGHLLDKSNRQQLASDINVAILVHQNRPEMSALDCVYRQLLAVNKELIYLGHGHSAFLNLTSD
ncbi:unnamed protein product [Absidia cylindrospora]